MANELAGGNNGEADRLQWAQKRVINVVALILAGFFCFLAFSTSVQLPTATTVILSISGLLLLLSVRPIGKARAETREEISSVIRRLSSNCMVVKGIAARYGHIDNLLIREDGALFLIETKSHQGTITEDQGVLRRNGLPLENDFLRRTSTNVFWLRDMLIERVKIHSWINAAIVFPNASVEVRGTVYGVDVLDPGNLEEWMRKARGNPEIAKLLADERNEFREALLTGKSPVHA